MQDGYEVINLEKYPPKNKVPQHVWKQVDITNKQAFIQILQEFLSDYIVHLAARTNLNGKTLDDYEVNKVGVHNLLDCI